MTPEDERNREIANLRERLSRLSQASLRITEDVDLDIVFQEVLDGARLLTGAKRGGMTTLDDFGSLRDSSRRDSPRRSINCALTCRGDWSSSPT